MKGPLSKPVLDHLKRTFIFQSNKQNCSFLINKCSFKINQNKVINQIATKIKIKIKLINDLFFILF